jgi:hypothetical protein
VEFATFELPWKVDGEYFDAVENIDKAADIERWIPSMSRASAN